MVHLEYERIADYLLLWESLATYVVATTAHCSASKVLIYDFLYSSVDQATLQLAIYLFGANCRIEMGQSPKQL